VHLIDAVEHCLNLREIRLLGRHAHRSQLVLQSIEILVFVDNEQAIQTGRLQEDEFALG
jgi:hypothetical protein